MPRRARIAIAGIAWHIIQRGNNRSACFFHDDDYRYFLATLAEHSHRWNCAVHAWVLMTNHVHLLVTPDRADGPAHLMKNLGQRYVQYVNRTYRRTGTLWDGRYRSCLAQEREYVLTCYRYIELNPVRAGMVGNPADYPWSSFRANARGTGDDVLSPHPDYLALGRTSDERAAGYRRLVGTHLDADTLDDIRRATNGNFVLGNHRFEQEIADALARRVTRGRPGRPKDASCRG
jgi:putative transposase